MEEVAHEAEEILDHVRSGRSALTSASIDSVLRAADYLKESISMCLESPRNLAKIDNTFPVSAPLLPVGHLFSKMERVVRDLASKSGKLVAFETNGENTELERTTVKRLTAPMLHMMRNSVDHGLETREERLAHGKPASGVVRLGAEQEAGHILISVSDDGRGLNKQRIFARAQKRGLIDEQARLTDDDIFRLVFQPGFSTAEQVTEISGRGVGMDIVFRQIQKLRGTIQIESVEGKGCTFTLRLPLISRADACF